MEVIEELAKGPCVSRSCLVHQPLDRGIVKTHNERPCGPLGPGRMPLGIGTATRSPPRRNASAWNPADTAWSYASASACLARDKMGRAGRGGCRARHKGAHPGRVIRRDPTLVDRADREIVGVAGEVIANRLFPAAIVGQLDAESNGHPAWRPPFRS